MFMWNIAWTKYPYKSKMASVIFLMYITYIL